MNKERYQMVNLISNELMDISDTLMLLVQQESMSTNGKSKDLELIEEAFSLVIEASEKLDGIDY